MSQMKLTKLTPLQLALHKSRQKTLKPQSKLNLVEWADTYRYLSPEASAIPGKWRTEVVEAARQPMLAATDPKIHTVTVMGATQLLKTDLINNIVGYHIHQDPCPIVVMYPNLKAAEMWANDRLDKMLRDTPVLTELVPPKRSKAKADGSKNNALLKTYPGGYVAVIGANSPTDLSSRPVRIVLCDEVDKYPLSAGKEGDPIKLLEERTSTFFNRKHIRVCSPTIAGISRIEEEFEKGDQRYYHALCQHCGKYEKLVWTQVRYDKTNPDDTTFYECSHCGSLWDDIDRMTAVNYGTYIAEKPFNGHASFHVNRIASPWTNLSEIVKKFLDCKNDPEKLKTFYNTQLAESWKVKSDAPDWNRLYERREQYQTNKPVKEVLFITAGVDVQGNRLEVELIGWGKDKESWSIDYRVIPGATQTNQPWDELKKILSEKWMTEDGRQLQVAVMCIDSGFNTQHVYNFVRNQDQQRVRAVKGQDHLQMVFGKPTDVEVNFEGRTIKNATRVWPVGSSLIKAEIYSWLKLNAAIDGEIYPAGYCHIPEYDETYFKGLCSEQLVETKVKGRVKNYWEKIFNRNEPLDVRVYARAAASMYGIDRFDENDWEVLKSGILLDEELPKSAINDSPTSIEDDYWSNSRGGNSNGRSFW